MWGERELRDTGGSGTVTPEGDSVRVPAKVNNVLFDESQSGGLIEQPVVSAIRAFSEES